MNIANVKLILAREVRDQMRDQRTLFMIFVLPVLLYPLLGTAYFEVFQLRTQTMSVLIVGGQQLEKSPTPLIQDGGFAPDLFLDGREEAKLLKLTMSDETSSDACAFEDARIDAERQVRDKKYDAAIVFPPDFAQRLDGYRKAIQAETAARIAGASHKPERAAPAGGTTAVAEIPQPKIIYTTANERSLMASSRLAGVLNRWMDEVGKANLVAGGLPPEAVRPFEVIGANLSSSTAGKAANIWSRLLPILMILWAMTGAFYPAIDLCAGEKERGTLETLLSSPAERSEIVLGKLLTIMVFSMATAALNLICVSVTGGLVVRQIPGFGGPPATAMIWLALAMVPASALFSALCLALASFARSTKEGQYYLMPLLLLTLPLTIMPAMPGVELNLGTALLPVSGMVLLLKTLLEGSYGQALQFLPVVLAVTFAACWLSVRWAVEQFNTESVLFRESERFDVGLWFKRLVRERGPLPSVAEGVFCGVVVLAVSFILRAAAAQPHDFGSLARSTLVLQLAGIVTPALIMAVMLTRSTRRTLRLTLPRWRMVPAAAVLAVALHPFILALGSLIVWLYPIAPEVQAKFEEMQRLFASGNVWMVVLVVAAMPAICEELAFRGFILSGCGSLGNNRRAIVVSAVFFGLAHGMLQHSIGTFFMGLVLGYLVVRSGSLLPGMVFHFLNNAMLVLAAKVTPELIDRFPTLGLLVHPTSQGVTYQWPVYLFGGVTSLALLGWFAWFPEAKTAEEVLRKAYEPSESDTMEDTSARLVAASEEAR